MMMNFLRSEALDVNGNAYEAKYYQNAGHNGEINYTVEVSIDGNDRIILDDMVLEKLEWKLRRIINYAVFSRQLAKALPKGRNYRIDVNRGMRGVFL